MVEAVLTKEAVIVFVLLGRFILPKAEHTEEEKVKLYTALLTGALGMILSGVIHIDDAYRPVNWMTIFLLAGLIPLGAAFEKTGAADSIALKLMENLGDHTPMVLMVAVALLISMFSLVTSNVGATVLMVPFAMNMALQSGADPRIMALTVGIAASNTFVLPTHQVNALFIRPGGYKTMDYIKAGSGMTIFVFIYPGWYPFVVLKQLNICR